MMAVTWDGELSLKDGSQGLDNGAEGKKEPGPLTTGVATSSLGCLPLGFFYIREK